MPTNHEAAMPTTTPGPAASADERDARTPPAWLDRSEYPFRSRWLRLPSGEAMHYVDEGEGEAVLFVHGTPTWSFEWRHLIRAVSGRFRCIAPDHLGFGLSDRPRDGAYTPEWHARNLAAFVEAVGVERLTLVVHDFGGPIGLPLALQSRRRVARLVLLNTWLWSVRGDRAMERVARLIGGRLGRWLYERLNFSLRVIMPQAWADRSALTAETHAQYLAPFPDAWSRGAVLWRLAQSLLGSSSYYESLWQRSAMLRELPALIVWGTKDPAFRPHHLARWREALPEARVVELPAGHWPHEERPEEVGAEVGCFVESAR